MERMLRTVHTTIQSFRKNEMGQNETIMLQCHMPYTHTAESVRNCTIIDVRIEEGTYITGFDQIIFERIELFVLIRSLGCHSIIGTYDCTNKDIE